MNKLTMAAIAVVTLTSTSILPVLAGYTTNCRQGCEENHGDKPSCFDQLGHMKRVFPAEVLGIDNGYRVWITEFCPTSDLMRSDGNGSNLRTAIADNDVLTDALQGKGYHADDVFAVKMMGDDTISLYVHRFGD